MPERVILHSDLNNFYASVECLHNPEIRNKPVVVGGDAEIRHGIVLAKNAIAKKTGIKTGQVLWQAQQQCPGLIIVPPNYPLYLRYSKMSRSIYSDYTDQIEPFGLDECWLDVTNSRQFGDGETIANAIRQRIKNELGVSVSIGVSYNKIFAKLGSDMHKPDATTVIRPDNYQAIVWPLPVDDLLYVGRATKRKLSTIGVDTIGKLAKLEPVFLRTYFGKWGDVLHCFANGLDRSPVMQMGDESVIKGIGNSTTTPRDLTCDEDVHLVMFVLCENIALRLREHDLIGKTVQISIRDNELFSFERQGKLLRPSYLSNDIHEKALQLFKTNYHWNKPLRSIGVRVTDLCPANAQIQLSLFDDEKQHKKQEIIESTVIALRRRFGRQAVKRAILLSDKMGRINSMDDHIIHNTGSFKERLP